MATASVPLTVVEREVTPVKERYAHHVEEVRGDDPETRPRILFAIGGSKAISAERDSGGSAQCCPRHARE